MCYQYKRDAFCIEHPAAVLLDVASPHRALTSLVRLTTLTMNDCHITEPSGEREVPALGTCSNLKLLSRSCKTSW